MLDQVQARNRDNDRTRLQRLGDEIRDQTLASAAGQLSSATRVIDEVLSKPRRGAADLSPAFRIPFARKVDIEWGTRYSGINNTAAQNLVGQLRANPMLTITRVALPKEQLQKLTAGERSLFLLFGYASNQINTLWKLVVVATNQGPKDPVEERVSGAQTQIFVRLLIGIMREALKLIEKRFLGSTLGKEYVERLSTQATDALNRLKRRFGAPDKYVVIRDNFSFHHPSLDDMEAAFQLAVKSDGDDSDWRMYLESTLLNTFFFASDFVLVHGMANALGETDVNEAHRKLLGDIAPIANDLSTFAFGFAEAIFSKYFGEQTATQATQIEDAPKIEELRLPWFVDTTGSFSTDGSD